MANVQIFSGDPGAAILTLDASMRLDPHYPDIALQFLADARFSLGEYEQAVVAIEKRLERNPQSETAYALLASCYMEGRLPRGFCIKRLTDLPMLWSEQWGAIGLQAPAQVRAELG